MKKLTTIAAASAVALAGVFAPASTATAGDREDALLGAFVGGLLGSALGNGGFNGGNVIQREIQRETRGHVRLPNVQTNRNNGVYLSCEDKMYAYDTAFDRAARDGKIVPGEHNQLEQIRRTPVSRDRGCNFGRPY